MVLDKRINAIVTLRPYDAPKIEFHFSSALVARSFFERVQDASNPCPASLWVRHNDRCDYIQFTPNGG